MATWSGQWIVPNKHKLLGELNILVEENTVSQFKRNPAIAGFWGYDTGSTELARAAFGYVSENYSSILSDIANFKSIDNQGQPVLRDVEGTTGYASAAAMFYMKVYGDLVNLKTDLTGLTIREVGCGAGSLAAQAVAIGDVSAWYCTDIPEISRFQDIYFSALGVSPTTEDTNNITTGLTEDLFVSLFHYAELDSTGRAWYRDNIINQCNGVYILNHGNNVSNATLVTELESLGNIDTVSSVTEEVFNALGVANPPTMLTWAASASPSVVSAMPNPANSGSSETIFVTLSDMPAGFTLDDITVNGTSLDSVSKFNDTIVQGNANNPPRTGTLTVFYNSGSSVSYGVPMEIS